VYLLYDGVCKAGDAKYNTDADCTAWCRPRPAIPRKIIFKAAELSQDCPSLTTNHCGEHAQHCCVVKKTHDKIALYNFTIFFGAVLTMSKLHVNNYYVYNLYASIKATDKLMFC